MRAVHGFGCGNGMASDPRENPPDGTDDEIAALGQGTWLVKTPDFNNKRERIPCLLAGDENPRRKTAALYAL